MKKYRNTRTGKVYTATKSDSEYTLEDGSTMSKREFLDTHIRVIENIPKHKQKCKNMRGQRYTRTVINKSLRAVNIKRADKRRRQILIDRGLDPDTPREEGFK